MRRHTLLHVGIVMVAVMAAGIGKPDVEDGSPGASLAWTSDEPAVVAARRLIMQGKLAEAESTLDDSTEAQRQTRETLRRIRRDYSLEEAKLLEKLRKSIPDVTLADVQRWRDAKQLQFREIDGRVVYFNREPSNLLRFNDDAKKRRDAHAKPAGKSENVKPKFALTDHLSDVIAAAQQGHGPEVLPVRHRITYTLTIEPNRPGAKAGSVARVWLPFPKEYRQQNDVRLISTSPSVTTVAPNDAQQRTLYFEQAIEDPARPLVFNAVYEYTSYAYYPDLDPAKAQPLPSDWGGAYLTERPPHIAFTPELRAKVREIVGDESNPLERVRKIYMWIDANVPWAAEEEYAIIPCLAMHGLKNKRGDCGVVSMLLITMCRIAGVPARWQSGWETKPVDWNMHDWAEVYVEPWGWLPCDVSYGLQKSDDPRVREFYIGHQDSYRMIVNTDYGRELVPPKRSLRSEPADLQRGEVEIDGRNLYFDEWDYEFKFEQTPG
jgi:transglutaminase-like putative cysteine protease